MKLIIRADGVIRRGPERDLIDDYLTRAKHLSRAQGISAIDEIEFDVKASLSKFEQTEAIIGTPEPGSIIVALDERGKALTSPAFARQITEWRDRQPPCLQFCIGPADGFDHSSLPKGTQLLSFGKAVWPHKLVRVMLAEQIYRALTILAGHPYHRE